MQWKPSKIASRQAGHEDKSSGGRAYVAVLVRRGFDPEMAARIYRAAASHIMGYLYLELGGFFGSAEESFRRGGLEKAGPEQYPHLSKLVPSLSAWDPEREFEASLRRLLAGFHRDMNRDSDQVAREMLLDDS